MTPRPRAASRYATELVDAASAGDYDFCVGGACYPEVHLEAPDLETDLRNLRARRSTAGVRFLITQLFFDNDALLRLRRARRATAGIDVPIIPGIMPITNVEQIKRFTPMCGATIPAALLAELEQRSDDPEAVARARRRLRDAPVRRPARARRARHPLLHAQPLAGDARDPRGAQAPPAVGARAQDQPALSHL